MTILDGTTDDPLQSLKKSIRLAEARPVKGRVVEAVGTIIEALIPSARIGEICILEDASKGWKLAAEVVGLQDGKVLLTPLGSTRGLSSHAEVTSTGSMGEVHVGNGLLGRVLDGSGVPIDNLGPVQGPTVARPIHAEAPNPLSRKLIDSQITLGIKAIDGLLACGEGQRMGIYGEPGDGKSTLVAEIVKNAEIDVAVIGLIGERGREVREFLEHQLAGGRSRAVLVIATSDRPAMERVRAAYVATAVAEYFRDLGRRVLLIMDSVTRFARAQREIGLSAGEPPTRRGFPPSVFTLLPQLMERAGPSDKGSITALYSVLMEGDGSGDPIAEETRGVLDGHIILSSKLAMANHYPAIDVLASRSRLMNTIASEHHQALATRMRELLAKYRDVEFLIQVGEYKHGSDAKADEAIAKNEALKNFLRQKTNEKAKLENTLSWMSQALS